MTITCMYSKGANFEPAFPKYMQVNLFLNYDFCCCGPYVNTLPLPCYWVGMHLLISIL
jgi:hypothetical protein